MKKVGGFIIVNIIILLQICLTGAFDDEDITHVDGSIDPVRDLKTILKELRLKVKF